MVKIIAILGLFALVGCASDAIKINTDVKEQKVEVLYCPAPPEVLRPVLPIHQMTPAQKKEPGEIAKYYKATVKTLIGYSKELEKVVDKQKEINTEYEKKKAEFDVPVKQTEE